jgi:hypothetical protein
VRRITEISGNEPLLKTQKTIIFWLELARETAKKLLKINSEKMKEVYSIKMVQLLFQPSGKLCTCMHVV